MNENDKKKKYINIDSINFKSIGINNDEAKNSETNRYQDIYKNKKEHLFNIEKQRKIKRNIIKNKEIMNKSLEKRQIMQEESDLSNRNRANSCERRKGKKLMPKILNQETILYKNRNLKEYIKDLKDYQSKHRNKNNNYNPDKYLNILTSDERFFKAYYDDNIPINKEINTEKKEEQLKKYVHDRKYLKNEIKRLNDSFSIREKRKLIKERQRRNKSEEKRFFADSKDFPKYNCEINKQIQLESHIFNTNQPKEKDYFEEAKKIYYRLENYQKNKNKINKRVFPINLKSKNNKIVINKIVNNSHALNIKSADLQQYSNNTISYTGKMKDIIKLNNSRNFNLITGKEIIKKIPSNNKKNEKENEKTENKIIEEIIESIPNLSDHNKIQMRMKASIFDFKNDKDLSKKKDEFIEFYKTNPNKAKKKNFITLKIGEKNNNDDFKEDNLNKKPSDKYIMTYRSKGTYDKFDSSEIKDIFCQKGIQAYDIHSKNSNNLDNINTISFKLKGENEEKIKSVENDLKKENYKLKIRKDDNKNNINNEKFNKVNDEKKFKIMPMERFKRKGNLNKLWKY